MVSQRKKALVTPYAYCYSASRDCMLVTGWCGGPMALLQWNQGGSDGGAPVVHDLC